MDTGGSGWAEEHSLSQGVQCLLGGKGLVCSRGEGTLRLGDLDSGCEAKPRWLWTLSHVNTACLAEPRGGGHG